MRNGLHSVISLAICIRQFAEFITSIPYDLWFPELARETKDGPDSRKLEIRCFVGFFLIQNKRGNMKSPLAQGKKVLFLEN